MAKAGKMVPRPLRLRPFQVGLWGFIFIMVLMMGVQVQDIAQIMFQGHTPKAVPAAQAEEPETTEKKQADQGSTPAGNPVVSPPVLTAAPAASIDMPGANPGTNSGDCETSLLKELSQRRQALDQRSQAVDQREALLKVAEQRVDKKMLAMQATQDQVRQMLNDVGSQRKAQAESLVKIYETMKAKEAARIFETLDMPTLLTVVQKMKESKVAPILAAMDPLKAKEITTALIDKKPLPVMP